MEERKATSGWIREAIEDLLLIELRDRLLLESEHAFASAEDEPDPKYTAEEEREDPPPAGRAEAGRHEADAEANPRGGGGREGGGGRDATVQCDGERGRKEGRHLSSPLACRSAAPTRTLLEPRLSLLPVSSHAEKNASDPSSGSSCPSCPSSSAPLRASSLVSLASVASVSPPSSAPPASADSATRRPLSVSPGAPRASSADFRASSAAASSSPPLSSLTAVPSSYAEAPVPAPPAFSSRASPFCAASSAVSFYSPFGFASSAPSASSSALSLSRSRVRAFPATSFSVQSRPTEFLPCRLLEVCRHELRPDILLLLLSDGASTALAALKPPSSRASVSGAPSPPSASACVATSRPSRGCASPSPPPRAAPSPAESPWPLGSSSSACEAAPTQTPTQTPTPTPTPPARTGKSCRTRRSVGRRRYREARLPLRAPPWRSVGEGAAAGGAEDVRRAGRHGGGAGSAGVTGDKERKARRLGEEATGCALRSESAARPGGEARAGTTEGRENARERSCRNEEGNSASSGVLLERSSRHKAQKKGEAGRRKTRAQETEDLWSWLIARNWKGTGAPWDFYSSEDIDDLFAELRNLRSGYFEVLLAPRIARGLSSSLPCLLLTAIYPLVSTPLPQQSLALSLPPPLGPSPPLGAARSSLRMSAGTPAIKPTTLSGSLAHAGGFSLHAPRSQLRPCSSFRSASSASPGVPSAVSSSPARVTAVSSLRAASAVRPVAAPAAAARFGAPSSLPTRQEPESGGAPSLGPPSSSPTAVSRATAPRGFLPWSSSPSSFSSAVPPSGSSPLPESSSTSRAACGFSSSLSSDCSPSPSFASSRREDALRQGCARGRATEAQTSVSGKERELAAWRSEHVGHSARATEGGGSGEEKDEALRDGAGGEAARSVLCQDARSMNLRENGEGDAELPSVATTKQSDGKNREAGSASNLDLLRGADSARAAAAASGEEGSPPSAYDSLSAGSSRNAAEDAPAEARASQEEARGFKGAGRAEGEACEARAKGSCSEERGPPDGQVQENERGEPGRVSGPSVGEGTVARGRGDEHDASQLGSDVSLPSAATQALSLWGSAGSLSSRSNASGDTQVTVPLEASLTSQRSSASQPPPSVSSSSGPPDHTQSPLAVLSQASSASASSVSPSAASASRASSSSASSSPRPSPSPAEEATRSASSAEPLRRVDRGGLAPSGASGKRRLPPSTVPRTEEKRRKTTSAAPIYVDDEPEEIAISDDDDDESAKRASAPVPPEHSTGPSAIFEAEQRNEKPPGGTFSPQALFQTLRNANGGIIDMEVLRKFRNEAATKSPVLRQMKEANAKLAAAVELIKRRRQRGTPKALPHRNE
ncbi:hypothetical protein BESB_073320 [Besnoitia besnoiti]|uniref:Uncharacterized protein n=1 Tax=Besnoitia besnoiti TaxID=94643 RepID=A0A2A9MFM4_BESBE|nr:uncharacterized protein BESB_073320 [Besnoitia besnoiti]PFH34180.1 hypothetical protein BESB_073320 [Besnoitia besnoiti]